MTSRVVLLACLGLLVSVGHAHAESGVPGVDAGTPCWPGVIAPAAGRVPANLSAWRFDTGLPPSSPPRLELVQRFGPMDEPRGLDIVPFEGHLVLRPVEPLVPGGEYAIIDRACPFVGEAAERVFFVDPEAPLPESLGVTTVSELRVTRPRPGGALRYHVLVGLELSDEARAAAALYESTVAMSGRVEPWQPAPLEDQSEESVVQCRSNGAEEIVSETFRHLGRRPGEDTSLGTESVSIEARCADAVRVHPRTGEPLTPEEIEAMDRIPDAGPPSMLDAGVMPLDGSLQPDVSGMEPVEGCSCRAVGGGGSTRGLGLLGLVCLLVLSRGLRRR